MMKNSFRNPQTNVLTAAGYCPTNIEGEIAREESDEFALEPGKWRLVDGEWHPYEAPPDIQSQIDKLERDSMLNRGSRELQLFLMEERAAQVAAARGVPVEAILSANIYYTKLKPLDLQIAALREQIK